MRNPLSRRRSTAPEEQPTEVVTALEDARDAEDGSATVVLDPAELAAAAAGAPQSEPTAGAAVPAGAESAPSDSLSFQDRGRLRRRLRYLRRVRELGFRDLGGLVFDLHRFGRQGDHLISGKLNALAAVDGELRKLEQVLSEQRDVVTLREAGIAACPRCGALHESEANFCPSCGIALSGPLAVAEVSVGAPPGAVTASAPTSTSLFEDRAAAREAERVETERAVGERAEALRLEDERAEAERAEAAATASPEHDDDAPADGNTDPEPAEDADAPGGPRS